MRPFTRCANKLLRTRRHYGLSSANRFNTPTTPNYNVSLRRSIATILKHPDDLAAFTSTSATSSTKQHHRRRRFGAATRRSLSSAKPNIDGVRCDDDSGINLEDDAIERGDRRPEINDDGKEGRDETLLEHYESLVRAGEVARDVHQIRALRELDRLRRECLPYFEELDEKKGESTGDDGVEEEDDSWSVTGLFSLTPSWANPSTTGGGGDDAAAESKMRRRRKPTASSPPRGVYLHGGVGCGKTHCMDLFYNLLPLPGMDKQKVHFHKFMLNVHKSMHEAKTKLDLRGDEVIEHVIRSTLSEGRMLCFDEFQVTDVADAMILRRLFTGLVEEGAVIVATSNRPPGDLYLGGLQRDLFLPFIDLLEERCAVVSMWESDVDYRLASRRENNDVSRVGVYFADDERRDDDNDGTTARESYEDLFRALTEGSPVGSAVLETQGREVFVPSASEERGIARFSFYDLCGTAKGAADYLAVAERFHTVFVEDVPMLGRHEVNLVRRWITLVDALYECRARLVVHAATGPEGMFRVDLEDEHCDEAFAFDRTRSRMEEMRGEGYLRKKWVGSRARP